MRPPGFSFPCIFFDLDEIKLMKWSWFPALKQLCLTLQMCISGSNPWHFIRQVIFIMLCSGGKKRRFKWEKLEMCSSVRQLVVALYLWLGDKAVVCTPPLLYSYIYEPEVNCNSSAWSHAFFNILCVWDFFLSQFPHLKCLFTVILYICS